MAQHIIESVTFKLNDGTDPATFIAAADAMGAWVGAQPGFIRRRLSRTEDGTWIEHIEWSDMASAKAASAAIGAEPANADFLMAIDGPSVVMSHSQLEVSVN